MLHSVSRLFLGCLLRSRRRLKGYVCCFSSLGVLSVYVPLPSPSTHTLATQTHKPPQGSMPTDGTLLLEHMPKGKQYLVTALSVFFSFGAVLSAVVALVVVPGHSCVSGIGGVGGCDVEENKGWKYMLMSLGVIVRFLYSHPSSPLSTTSRLTPPTTFHRPYQCS